LSATSERVLHSPNGLQLEARQIRRGKAGAWEWNDKEEKETTRRAQEEDNAKDTVRCPFFSAVKLQREGRKIAKEHKSLNAKAANPRRNVTASTQRPPSHYSKNQGS
jgi:hypothetical protein